MNPSVGTGICPIQFTLSLIGGKWKVIILYQIHLGPVRRYGELKRLVPGITHKMLSQQLKELERDDLIQRQEYPQVPPKVEYSLTPNGRTVLPVIQVMSQWGERQMAKTRLAEALE